MNFFTCWSQLTYSCNKPSAIRTPEDKVMTCLLLLPLSVLRNEACKAFVDATLLEPCLKFLLDGHIERVELRADVQTAALPVRLSRQLSADSSVRVEGDVVDEERALLAQRIDVDGTSGASLAHIK